MPRIQPVDSNNVPEAPRPYIEQGKQITGGEVINYLKQMGVSPTSFKGYINLSGTLQGGALDRQTQEAIAVSVSNYHGCFY